MRKFISKLLFTIVLILLLGRNAFAVLKTTTQSGNWSSSSTWGGTTAPVSGDNVIIKGEFTVIVDIPNATFSGIQI